MLSVFSAFQVFLARIMYVNATHNIILTYIIMANLFRDVLI
ncbi:putative membrane protein [Candidatus Neoehrlichia lotoris str. RAC413]|uniref:Putative membrane protein n=1 Tax=Candidatus Neoehrlichia procyonis str. RAC413 TaxID=1359163 RepID=A0A0F3NLQ2_9RICK|nr:putative membrane protein [Candidatus Neoehrlichia lotoris str. RAC413]